MPSSIDPARYPESARIRAAFAQALGVDPDEGNIDALLAGALGVSPPADQAIIAGHVATITASLEAMRDAAADEPTRCRLAALADLYEHHADAPDDRLLLVSTALAQVGRIAAPQKLGMDRLAEVFSIALGGQHGVVPGISWCGLFALWAHKMADVDVGDWVVSRTIGSVKGFSPVEGQPELGDVGLESTSVGHMFIVIRVNDDGTLYTVDGNTGGNDVSGGTVNVWPDKRKLAGSTFFRAC